MLRFFESPGRILRTMPIFLFMMSLCAFAQGPAPAVICIDAGGPAIGSRSADMDFSARRLRL